MDRYNKYIEGLRGYKKGLDGERMLKGIEGRVMMRRNVTIGSIAGTLAVCAITAALFFTYSPTIAGSDDLVSSYVFGQSDVADGPVINYVFGE